MVAITGITMFLLMLPVDAEAAKRRGRDNSNHNRRAAAAAKARKEQLIKNTQQQIAVAQKVLDSAESRAAMSQAEVNQALSKLSRIRDDIESAHDGVQQAAKTLRDIEAEILSKQPDNSELARIQSMLNQAKIAVHREIHRTLRLPDGHDKPSDAGGLSDLAKLSTVERELLEKDDGYQHAQDRLKELARSKERIQQKLFRADSDWRVANQDLADAEKSDQAGHKEAHASGIGSLDDRQDLRQAQKVAAAARAIIAQGESRLRQLGAKKK